MKHVEFLENTLFKVMATFADHLSLNLLLDELSMYKRDGDGYFSGVWIGTVALECPKSQTLSSGYTSHNLTDS